MAAAKAQVLGKQKKAQITLVERSRTHIWKPHLHEVAAGTMDVGRDAVDFLAQASDLRRGPGLYLNLFMFVPVVLTYILWVYTTHWVQKDTKDLNNVRFEMWNSVALFSGLLGFVLLWLIPIYFVGLLLLLLAYFGPLFAYVYSRNQTVPDEATAKGVVRLVDALEDNDDVQAVYANFDIPDDVLQAVVA